MMEKKAPKRIVDFLDHYENLGFHLMRYNKDKHPIELKNLVGILRTGITSPQKAAKIEKKARTKIFTMDPKRGKDHKGEFFGPELYYRGFVQHKSKINPFSFLGNSLIKAGLNAHATSTGQLPGILFSKPGLEYEITGKPKEFLTTKFRIQSRYILAVVLPYLEKKERSVWLDRIREFGKPVYDHDGNLIWKPHSEKG